MNENPGLVAVPIRSYLNLLNRGWCQACNSAIRQLVNSAELRSGFTRIVWVKLQNCRPGTILTVVNRVGRLKGYSFGGLPSIEVYRTTRVDANHEMNHTEIYIPVSRKKN